MQQKCACRGGFSRRPLAQVSYRLVVSRDGEEGFLYSIRGMPKEASWHPAFQLLVWGNLSLLFASAEDAVVVKEAR